MEETAKGQSNAPMILGIVGFVAMIPGLLCAAACGACVVGVEAMATGQAGTGSGIIVLTLFPMVAGFVFGFLSKSQPTISGIVMVASAAFMLIPVIMSANWFFGLITIACYLIGGILSFQNKAPESV
ncbi:MAG: hypothetical protein GX881_04425 [Firmicutes bacterium]|nr:hypothetical protein [Bacillota bacterium]